MTTREEFARIIQLFLVVGADRFASERIKTAQLPLRESPHSNLGDGHE